MKTLIYLLLELFISNLCYSQIAEEYYNIGNEKYLQGNYTGAIKSYSKAIQ